MLLLVGVLDKEKETLAGLAGPGGNGVSNLRLFATKVLLQVGSIDRLLAEPKVLLGEAESAGSRVSIWWGDWRARAKTYFLSPGAL